MGPLAEIRVLEFGAIGPAPFAAMMLADMGAEVVRIDRETTPADDGSANDMIRRTSASEIAVINRGRRSVSINLKTPAGVETALQLARHAHILVEGFRPGVMERLGLGPEICFQRNPALIYGRMTGWGQTGPMAHAPGHDPNYVAITGALHLARSASPGVAPTIPAGFGDFGGGGMFLAFGVLAALVEARQSGVGQVVDAAICDGTSLLLAPVYTMLAAGIWKAEPGANALYGAAHFFANYECSDRLWLSVGAIEPQFYRDLITRLGLAEDPDFLRQMDERLWPQLRLRLAELFRQRTRAEWCDLLEGTDACVAPILDLTEATRHPQLVARNRYVDIAGVLQPAPAPLFSRTVPATPSRPPLPGADTDAVLAKWGVEPGLRA
jgi:alpha-methylacyl-CoA racemase